MEFVQYDNSRIRPQAQGLDFGMDMGVRVPVFDIKIRSQKSSPFSKLAQNELAKEFFGMGFFHPQMADQALACMEMMDFEGKDMVMNRVAQNGTLLQTVQQLQQQMAELTAVIQAMQGAAPAPEGEAPQPSGGGSGAGPAANPRGALVRPAGNAVEAARERALNAAGVG